MLHLNDFKTEQELIQAVEDYIYY
ncbi:hypothetical protein [Peribacillus butanolivorans]